MHYRKFYIDLGAYNCAVHHFGQDISKPCVILVHGSIENARIFYSISGKGFAPWLANKGFDVYAIDLPGKGESNPKINRQFKHSQSDFVIRDLNEIIRAIQLVNKSNQLHFVAHSWGGVLLSAFLSRHSLKVQSMVYFACKRRISIFSLKRVFMVDFVWNFIGTFLSNAFGYFPAKAIKIGSENESRKFFLQSNRWVYSKQWIEEEDDLDYTSALKENTAPPTLFLTGINDKVLGNPLDVELFKNEMPNPLHELKILAKNYGNLLDYNHINILTHHRAMDDHFNDAANWLKKFAENH